MQQPFPVFISVYFVVLVLLILFLLNRMLKTNKNSGLIQAGVAIWLLIQAMLAGNGLYHNHLDRFPPRLLLFGILPAVLFLVFLLLSKKGKAFAAGLPLQALTFFHTIRIFVELGLLLLYFEKTVPKLMTFEGGNLDIISGLTAPVLGYAAFSGKRVKRIPLLIWNFVCLFLLFNIVGRALLSAPFPSQKLAFDQPNVAILHFPVVWLPTFIVPLVFFAHLASIRQLIRKQDDI